MPGNTRTLPCSEVTEYYRVKSEGMDSKKGAACKRAEQALTGLILVREGR